MLPPNSFSPLQAIRKELKASKWNSGNQVFYEDARDMFHGGFELFFESRQIVVVVVLVEILERIGREEEASSFRTVLLSL